MLSYDKDTGVFIWKPRPEIKRFDRRWNVRWVGKEAGSYNREGYRLIALNYTKYMAHRIAWAMHYGEWPKLLIDHINGIPDDNRICNLRQAEHWQNMANAKLRKDNTSGYRGVSRDHYTGKWSAQIGVNGKCIRMGTFETKEEAYLAYCNASKALLGEFSSVYRSSDQ